MPDISVKQAMERLGVSRPTVLRWWHAGRLSGYQLGSATSAVRIDSKSVDRLIEQSKNKAPTRTTA